MGVMGWNFLSGLSSLSQKIVLAVGVLCAVLLVLHTLCCMLLIASCPPGQTLFLRTSNLETWVKTHAGYCSSLSLSMVCVSLHVSIRSCIQKHNKKLREQSLS